MRGGVIKVRRAKPGETDDDARRQEADADAGHAGDRRCRHARRHRRRDGRREFGNHQRDDARSCSKPRTSRRRRFARPARRSASRPKRRRASSAAWIAPRRRARWRARCELLEKIGAGKPTGAITDDYPRPHQPKALTLERARIAGLLGMDVPDADVERILTSLGFEIIDAPVYRPRRRRLGCRCAVVARRHSSPGRSDRRSRAPLRLRASADDVPWCGAGAAAVRSADCPRPRRFARRCSAWDSPRRSRSRSSRPRPPSRS